MHIYRGLVSTLRPKHISGDEENVSAESAGESEWIPLKNANGSVRTEHTYILLTQVRKLEETFTISPLSQPLDGKLRLISVGEVGVQELLGVLGRGYGEGVGSGNTEGEGHVVGYEEVEGLRIQFLEEDEDDDIKEDGDRDGVTDKEDKDEDKDEDEDKDKGSTQSSGKGTGVGKGKWRRVCIDGTVVECPKGGWVEARRNKDTGAAGRSRKAVELVTWASSDL